MAWVRYDGQQTLGGPSVDKTILPRREEGMWCTDGAWIEGVKVMCETKGWKCFELHGDCGQTYLRDLPNVEAFKRHLSPREDYSVFLWQDDADDRDSQDVLLATPYRARRHARSRTPRSGRHEAWKRVTQLPRSLPRGAGEIHCTPDPDAELCVWEGWGVSLCWWANVFGVRNDLADAAFTMQTVCINGTDVPGLGLSIVRVDAGGSAWRAVDNRAMQVSPRIPSWKQIRGFWEDWRNEDPNSSCWNWAPTQQLAMLRHANDRLGHSARVELFANSPIWWMCRNHNPSGGEDPQQDNLQCWNQDRHALYLATVAAHLRDHLGLAVASVEPFNEPSADWWKSDGRQEGCHIGPDTQAAVIQHLRAKLDAKGLSSTLIAASDENTYDAALSTWNALGDTARSLVGRLNVHGYQYGSGRRDLLCNAAQSKPVWNSEYADGDASGMTMARNLILDLRWLRCKGWCYWQLVDECHGWGLINFDSSTLEVGELNPKYWVLSHFTRHIRVGMRVVKCGEESIAAIDYASRRLVLVAINSRGACQTLSFDLSCFTASAASACRWTTDSGDKGLRYSKDRVKICGQRLNTELPPHSVQTLEISNVVSGRS